MWHGHPARTCSAGMWQRHLADNLSGQTKEPMLLKDIFCQERAIARLQRAFAAGRLAHAYIFAGAEGVGKETTARAWARMLLCGNRVEQKIPEPFFDSCGECESCRVFEGGGHPDYHLIEKELRPYTSRERGTEARKDLPISVIREFLVEKVASRPAMGGFSIFVIRQSERLNTSSQNALLKVLEEPPKHCPVQPGGPAAADNIITLPDDPVRAGGPGAHYTGLVGGWCGWRRGAILGTILRRPVGRGDHMGDTGAEGNHLLRNQDQACRIAGKAPVGC